MHWILIGILIGIGLLLARPILALLGIAAIILAYISIFAVLLGGTGYFFYRVMDYLSQL